MLRQLSQGVPFGVPETKGDSGGGLELHGVFGKDSESEADEESGGQDAEAVVYLIEKREFIVND
jgi:hypothetical protein